MSDLASHTEDYIRTSDKLCCSKVYNVTWHASQIGCVELPNARNVQIWSRSGRTRSWPGLQKHKMSSVSLKTGYGRSACHMCKADLMPQVYNNHGKARTNRLPLRRLDHTRLTVHLVARIQTRPVGQHAFTHIQTIDPS